jgi:hypothetical protein
MLVILHLEILLRLDELCLQALHLHPVLRQVCGKPNRDVLSFQLLGLLPFELDFMGANLLLGVIVLLVGHIVLFTSHVVH